MITTLSHQSAAVVYLITAVAVYILGVGATCSWVKNHYSDKRLQPIIGKLGVVFFLLGNDFLFRFVTRLQRIHGGELLILDTVPFFLNVVLLAGACWWFYSEWRCVR